MENTNQTKFWDDSRNWAKSITGIISLSAIGVFMAYYIFPLLLTVVWVGINLIIGLAVLATLLYLVTSKGTWRRLGYFNAKIAKLLTFWIISWDEFIIQEMAIEQAKKDRMIIKEQADTLFGQVAEKNDELSDAHDKYVEANGMINELRSQGRTDDDAELLLAASELSRQKDFIESITPLRDQMDELGKMCQKVFNDTGLKIKDAEAELKVQKAKLLSLTAGETAMNKALKIFSGENKDVLLAEEIVKKKIGEKIGSIRNTLDIITPIMNERALKDKVKVKAVLSNLKQSQPEIKSITDSSVTTKLTDKKYSTIFK